MRESDLYPAVKAHFQRQGYTVKGEVGAADVVARKDGAAPIVIELKLGFTITLLHQVVDRLAATEDVFVAVERPKSHKLIQRNTKLCRRLGVGFITVRARDLFLEVHCEPGPYNARVSKKKQVRLEKAFDRLDGDPNAGGATRHGLVTGYRQDALKCAAYLANAGAEKGAIVAKATGVPTATTIMRNNVYGWFQKVEKGVYALTKEGRKGLADWGDAV